MTTLFKIKVKRFFIRQKVRHISVFTPLSQVTLIIDVPGKVLSSGIISDMGAHCCHLLAQRLLDNPS
jgi:hypothetical protein